MIYNLPKRTASPMQRKRSKIKRQSTVHGREKTMSSPTGGVRQEARSRLAQADLARKANKADKAINICQNLVDEYPEYAAALHMLGLLHMARNAYWPALSCLSRASTLNPMDWSILASLGQVYMGLNSPSKAIPAIKRAAALAPNSDVVQYMLSECYYKIKLYDDAIIFIKKAISIEKKSDYFHLLGRCYNHIGHKEEATSNILKSYTIDNSRTNSLCELSYLGCFDLGAAGNIEPLLVEKARSSKGEQDPHDRARPQFALSNYYHTIGNYESAWEWLVSANASISGSADYAINLDDHKKHRSHLLEVAKQFNAPAKRSGSGETDCTPLFILGISRSGKTLAERLLSENPLVYAGYENPKVEYASKYASLSSGLLSIEKVSDLPHQLGPVFSNFFHQMVRDDISDQKIYTTTSPGLIGHVGQLADFLPNAKFVFIKRDFMDSLFRIFSKHYKSGTNLYSYDVEIASFEVSWYHEMIEIWNNKLGNRSIISNYSDINENPIEEIDKIHDICGIDRCDPKVSLIQSDVGCSKPYVERLQKLIAP